MTQLGLNVLGIFEFLKTEKLNAEK